MSKNNEHHSFTLDSDDLERLAALCGPQDNNIKLIEKNIGVKINRHSDKFTIKSDDPGKHQICENIICALYDETLHDKDLSSKKMNLIIHEMSHHQSNEHTDANSIKIHTKMGIIKARSFNQNEYLIKIKKHDICFGIGPAGTGKSFLAVASAIEALNNGEVNRIILTRPAVEAGEKLGFLPGDLAEKIDPYLRPLYDALHDMLGAERMNKMIEQRIIEIAPLAYMRGRTLNDAFVILDEGQNTTLEQMKMFLTRIGYNSKTVVNGDISQIDLAFKGHSGLVNALNILDGIDGICIHKFDTSDVVRHPLVKKIITAYDESERKNNKP